MLRFFKKAIIPKVIRKTNLGKKHETLVFVAKIFKKVIIPKVIRKTNLGEKHETLVFVAKIFDIK